MCSSDLEGLVEIRSGREALSIAAGETFQEGAGQRGDVFRALPQRWEFYRDYADPVIELFPDRKSVV